MTSEEDVPVVDDDHSVGVIIVDRREETDGVITLELEAVDGGPLPPWDAGSHIDIALPGGRQRQYSLIGSVERASRWRVAVLRDENGRGGSDWLHEHAQPGVHLNVSEPRNRFEFVAAESYIFVAGGIGITPLLSLAREAELSHLPWTLYFLGRSYRTMPFRPIVEQFTSKVRLHSSMDAGRFDIATLLHEVRPGAAVYCCGPQTLIDAVEDATRHWPADAIHLERFSSPANRGSTPASGFEVECAASGVTLSVAPHQSIYEAAESAGVAVYGSCLEGVCGACETAVLAGEIDHRDALLSPAERVANDTIMICVSRALGSRLVIDL